MQGLTDVFSECAGDCCGRGAPPDTLLFSGETTAGPAGPRGPEPCADGVGTRKRPAEMAAWATLVL